MCASVAEGDAETEGDGEGDRETAGERVTRADALGDVLANDVREADVDADCDLVFTRVAAPLRETSGERDPLDDTTVEREVVGERLPGAPPDADARLLASGDAVVENEPLGDGDGRGEALSEGDADIDRETRALPL